MAPLDRSHTSSYSSSIVTLTMAVSVTYRSQKQKKRNICRKTPIFHTLPFNLHDHLYPSIFPEISTQTAQVLKLLDGAKY